MHLLSNFSTQIVCFILSTVAALLHRVCWRVRRVRPRERGVLQVGAVLAHGRGGGGVDDEHAADAEAGGGTNLTRYSFP